MKNLVASNCLFIPFMLLVGIYMCVYLCACVCECVYSWCAHIHILFLKIYLCVWEREHVCKQGRRTEGAGEKQKREPQTGFDPTTPRSWPESKSRIRRLTNWATQASLFLLFMVFVYVCVCIHIERERWKTGRREKRCVAGCSKCMIQKWEQFQTFVFCYNCQLSYIMMKIVTYICVW